METTTITASITYPTADIEAFADRLGYQEQVANPAYEASLDPETGETTDNGEPATIDNPEDRVTFVKRMFKIHSVAWFTQFVERDAEQAAKVQKDATVATAKEAVEQAITI